MGSVIHSVGTYFPDRVLTNSELVRILALSNVETSDEWIFERTGIRNRRVASSDENVATMAYRASVSALNKIDHGVDPIKHIVVATNTNYRSFPNVAGYVQDKLFETFPKLIDRSASGVDLSAGCAGINFALMHADGLIKSGIYDSVLVIGAEHLSSITDYFNRSTCILFEDGASAYVLGKFDSGDYLTGFLGHYSKGDGANREDIYCEENCEKVTLEDALNALETNIPPVRTRGRVLSMNGTKVFKYVTRQWKDLFDGFVRNSKLNPYSIPPSRLKAIAPHLANFRCLENVNDEFPWFLEKCGFSKHNDLVNFCNSSTASQGARVERFLDSAEPGEHCLMVGYGSGLQFCANLYQKPLV